MLMLALLLSSFPIDATQKLRRSVRRPSLRNASRSSRMKSFRNMLKLPRKIEQHHCKGGFVVRGPSPDLSLVMEKDKSRSGRGINPDEGRVSQMGLGARPRERGTRIFQAERSQPCKQPLAVKMSAP